MKSKCGTQDVEDAVHNDMRIVELSSAEMFPVSVRVVLIGIPL